MSTGLILSLMMLMPLIAALINGSIGKYLPVKLIGFMATSVVFAAFGLSVMLFMNFVAAEKITLFTLLKIRETSINASFYVDALSIWMSMIITGVGALIHLFSTAYITEKDDFYKFFTYLNLFVFSMLLLVLGSNYFVLFFGWEGVGICSFLLIGFNYSDPETGFKNSMAARKAFIMNRIGDIGLLVALFLLINQFGTLEYSEIYKVVTAKDYEISGNFITALTLSLFFAATGKSAQIPLLTWLPDAMAGPTPVSALIHAATMVTAGIFLIIRSNYLFELAPLSKDIIVYIGLLTSIYGAFSAMRQNDIKKVLAYSTVSQLGLMFVALGTGAYTVALFHVTTHAFFKALLFLCAGSIIHALHHEQDIRNMGGLKKYMKITHLTFLLGTLAITGFPLMSGFFSKDEIMASAWMYSPIVFVLLIAVITMTSIYMFRLYFLVFHGTEKMDEHTKHHLKENPISMTLPLMILAILSVLGGIINLPGLIFHGSAHWFDKYLSKGTDGLSAIHPHHPDPAFTWGLMIAASALTIGILFWAYNTYARQLKTALSDSALKGWQKVSADKLYLDESYNFLFIKPIDNLAAFAYKFFELGTLLRSLRIFPKVFGFVGTVVAKLQQGFVGSYIFWMLIGLICFIGYSIIIIQFWN
jgi:NADH-quinone oxidoreductase subunit L